MTFPRVSVIMPFRDMEPFLEESVESVVRQTWADWELLMIDDGSVDGSPEIARRLVGSDPERIRLLTVPPGGEGGASAARNLGISQARGEYIALLDADDVWPDWSLRERVEILDRHPDLGMVLGRNLKWFSWDAGRGAEQGDFLDRLGIRSGRRMRGAEFLRRALSNRANMPATHCTLVRRAVVARSGGFEESFRFIYTDQAFFAKVLLETDVLPVDRCWGWYRQRSGSSSSVGRDREREFRGVFLSWLLDFLAREYPGERALARTVRREIWWLRRPHAVRRWRRFFRRLPGRIFDLVPGRPDAA
jgi:glycosyltransferase involved in cell wall biosynthesis